MSKDIYIYGKGGHSAVIIAILTEEKLYNISAIVDDLSQDQEFLGIPIITTVQLAEINNPRVFIAIGDNYVRKKVYSELVHLKGITFPNIIAKSSLIQGKELSCIGTCVMPGAIININQKIGDFCVVGTGAIVEHDCTMMNFSFVGPGCVIAGNVILEKNSMVGIKATVIQGKKIGENSLIGAGAVVTRSVTENSIVAGVPAQKIGTRKPEERFLLKGIGYTSHKD